MRCQLLMTGNELMTGITIDSNSAFIAEQLHGIGITVQKKVTVGDALQDLNDEIHQACQHCDLLIINGGLGPTDDDLTAQALAAASGQQLQQHPQALQHIHNWCSKRGISANLANLKQALLPQSASIIHNRIGSAVGIKMSIGQCLVLCTPGVPSEMHAMLTEEILPLLQAHFPESHSNFVKRLQVFGMGESTIQQKVHDNITDWPRKIELGFRAGFPTLEVKLTVKSRSDLSLRDQYENKLRQLLGACCFGEEQDTLASVVVRAFAQQQKVLVAAESCTGGLIASQITAIAGASKIFEAGFVTYSNKIKESILHVNHQTLLDHGAVSEETVRQMARGALEQSQADYVIAVTGIAGPDGGTDDKPVGTVWLAWGKREQQQCKKLFIPAERIQFQQLVAAYSLDLLRRDLLGITEQPRYLR